MKICINPQFIANVYNSFLGYLGETNARVIKIQQPDVEGADTYRLRFEYSDGVVYDVPIIDGKVIVTASLLREVGYVKCQWLATKAVGDSYDLVAKSQVFEVCIKPSISDDVAPIPPYELAKDIADRVLAAELNVAGYAKQADTSAQAVEQAKIAAETAKQRTDELSDKAVTASENAAESALTASTAAEVATQKADELASLLDELNASLETRLNGGVVSG